MGGKSGGVNPASPEEVKEAGHLAGNLLFCPTMEESMLFTSTDRFQERDFTYLTAVVAGQGDTGAFRRFVAERDALHQILDDPRVLGSLLETPTLLDVSPWFYFYVLTRQSLLRSGLDDVSLAEYLSSVLAERVPLAAGDTLGGIPGCLSRSVDFLAVLDKASGNMRFEALVAGGNQFLVLTGIFPEFIVRRSERHGAPGLQYYENMARASYCEAQEHPRAVRQGLKGVLGTLSEVLPEARRSLNRMADSLLFLAS